MGGGRTHALLAAGREENRPQMGRSTTRSSLLVVLFVFLLFAAASHGTDTLTQGQSLKDGKTLVSQGQVFELGFFTPPGGNSSRRYVGIWYYGLPSLAVVWIANRNDPLIGSAGSLSLGSDGNLAIFDGGGKQRWTSNITAPSRNSTVLQLMDNGNLFLNTRDGRALWQSFDHPSDTFLPGMKLTLDLASRRNQVFRSWKSPTDPAEGDYSVGLDPSGSGQVYIWKQSLPYWRSGQWNRRTFIGFKLRPLSFYGWNLDTGDGKMVLSFNQYNSSLFRFVMQWDGTENVSILVNDTQEWRSVFEQPTSQCEVYNRCGDNAMCIGDGAAACECLRGFQPRSAADWGAGNWSGGCQRRTPLKCEMNTTMASEVKDDGFWRVSGVKLPDFSVTWVSTVGDPDGCRRSCSGNCSCMAYSFVQEIGCMTWASSDNLVDVQQFSDGGYDLYIKLAGAELAHKEKTWIVILIICLLVVIIFILGFYLWRTYRAKIQEWWNRKNQKREVLLFDLGIGREVQPELMNPTEFVDQTTGKDGKSTELPLFGFDCIAAATGNFSASNQLGQGGFGHVYKGVLPDGREIAVKRLSETSGQGQEEFKNEVILIAKLQHRNLVRLMGCCIQEDEKILVYEYLKNKSLDAFIFNPSMKPLLDWSKRFNIIEGIARGLLYLHRDSRLRIIHRDLKASNILLDEEMIPKISDFGMARIFGGNQNQANTVRVVGTFGYMSPEYAMEGLFSIKSDVYSFGVLTLEIISGQRNNSYHRTENSPNLVGHAWRLWNEDRWLELVDPSIRGSISTREVKRCIQVGLLCVQDRANERPTMASVVFMLGSEAVAHPMPRQPTFTLEGSPTDTESMARDCESCTSSDVTVTVVTGR